MDWDGYVGIIPKTTATVPEVLREYGYETAAFGKWHNAPADQTTAMGPFDRWPTGHGFDHFYGFVAGETSQYEPRLYENNNPIEPPHDPTYHLSSDLADKAITWLHQHQSYSPDKPFFMWWTPGAAHGPHHIFNELANNYKGKFDDGWDEYRKRVFQNQKDIGWIPKEINGKPVVDTPRPDDLQGWDKIPEDQGGLTFFMDEKGRLRYEYNMMLIDRYKAKSEPIPAGHHTIEVQTTLESSEPLSPADVSITVDGVPAAFTTVERTVPGSFTASETFDVGTDLGSPVSRNYAHKIPFAFDGTINKVTVELLPMSES